MNAWYINGESLFSGNQPLLYFLVPYRISFFLFVFPETWIFNHVASLFPDFSIPISALNPRLNPGPQWGISIIPGLLYDFLLKLPLILADALVTIFLFKIVKSEWKDDKTASFVAAAWFLNPIVIWVSSGWGMNDSLPALFTVLSLYFVLKGKNSSSVFSLVVATLLKFYALAIFIPLLAIIWRRSGFRAMLISLVPSTILAALASLPLLFVTNPLSYVEPASSAASQYAGFSVWTSLWLTGSAPNVSAVAAVLTGISLIASYYFLLKKQSQHDKLTIVSCFFLIPIIALLLFYKFVGENYIVWLIPFSAILTAKSRRIDWTHWSISLLSFVSSITDSLLPYYLLPLSPWISGLLIGMLGLVAPARVAPTGTAPQGITIGKLFLSGLGVISFIILLVMLFSSFKILRQKDVRYVEETFEKA